MAEIEEKMSLSSLTMVDNLIHGKMDNGEEVIMFPYTRYENLLGSPKVVSELDTFNGAPFFFYQTDEVDIEQDIINALIGISTVEDEGL